MPDGPEGSRHLVIDIGNTNIKIAFFQGEEMFRLWVGSAVDDAHLREWIDPLQTEAAIISSVRISDNVSKQSGTLSESNAFETVAPEFNWLSTFNFPVLLAGPHLKLPITMRYKTPETLGSDRLAAAVAAAHMFSGQNTLVLTAGSCITADFVTEHGEYLGGTITPGLHMRLQAMHHFTGKLPLVNKIAEETPLIGDSTVASMMSGVINGITAEMDGLIAAWEKEIGFFNVILSGGDGKIFAKKVKSRIFAIDNIVLHGLNLMLKHNV